ncbi:hypothetical protein [Fusobacterium hominis]|uniref:Uncharacterized protein n=1 Tax=Fusobacterium hominis TaxID=2764326 RepID=A0A7G9GXI3_9FUSO|nr:hypothetical protein [Fusobacterium hominis]QNM15515.1 hypothetical protein H9Q81_01350 [Fusobacterium hominis]
MKYIYIGGTKSLNGIVLSKNTIVDEDVLKKIKAANPEIESKFVDLGYYAKNKKFIKTEKKPRNITIQ